MKSFAPTPKQPTSNKGKFHDLFLTNIGAVKQDNTYNTSANGHFSIPQITIYCGNHTHNIEWE